MRDAVLGLTAILCLTASTPAFAQDKADANALFVAVPNPITSEGFRFIRERVESARNDRDRPATKVVFDFNPDDKDAATTDFGACYSLAKFIAGLHGMDTIGFVHGKAAGHTVLPVLACKELAVSSASRLGPVAVEGVPPPGTVEKTAYAEILGDGRARLLAAVQKLYDPDVVLIKGVKNGSDWYVDRRAVAKARLEGVNGVRDETPPLPFGNPGQPGSYDPATLKAMGLCKLTAESRDQLAELYQIAPSTFRDPLQGRPPVAFHYVLKGEVDGGMRESLDRLIKDVKRKKGNILFLEVRCGGGDLAAARDLADDLRKHQTGDDAVLVVGFIPDRAPDSATFVALGCSEIVMSKRKDAAEANPNDEAREAEIGDFGAFLGKGGKAAPNADQFRKSLKELAELQGYPGILVDGMFDRDLEIVRAKSKTDRTRYRLMSAADLKADEANWEAAAQVKPKGQLLQLSATRAAELGVARRTVDNRDIKEVYAPYGVTPNSVREAEPGWLDRFADFLKRPEVTVLLVLVGFMGLMLELKAPGLTVPGITSALCFILVFWSQSRFSGETFVLAMLLFVLGLVLVALEIFVLPGFGAPGVVGILCMLAGLGLVTVERVPQTGGEWSDLGGRMGQYLLAMAGALAGAITIARYLPNIPGANRLVLGAPETGPGGAAEWHLPGADAAAGLLGAIGTTNTPLRPAGVVRFADAFVDVVSEGGYIPPGARVQVVEVEGTRIVVKEV